MIIDASIYGMGRGAGNLNTELLVGYLNENISNQYSIKPLLAIIDEVVGKFYQRNYWGYSLPNYLSAVHNIHPNYALYLSDKNTLTVEAMDEIFSLMEEKKSTIFDKDYISQLYFKYMAAERVKEERRNELRRNISGKKILLIAPGRSSETEKEKIITYSKQESVVTISVNFEYPYIDTTYIFTSNLRRFRELDERKKKQCIVTSNISASDIYLQTRYYDLLLPIEAVRDNAGMMVIKFLILFGVKEIVLAGFDGYSYDSLYNYASRDMLLFMKDSMIDELNEGMSEMLKLFKKEVNIQFLTESKYLL